MLKELTMLSPFFEDPYTVYSAREVARLTNNNHITISNKLKSLPYIKRAKNGPYTGFKAVITEEFLRLRWYYNLEKLKESGLIKALRSFYDEPAIILFGSYSTATNTKDSDIDIAVISTHKKQFKPEKFEAYLNHQLQLFLYTKKDIKNLKTENPELLNSICNGIVLNGELEVFI
ncbi:MAG: nucleotidyltransferase domain-containing protein [Candidatus Nanoarchaeia archaeon]